MAKHYSCIDYSEFLVIFPAFLAHGFIIDVAILENGYATNYNAYFALRQTTPPLSNPGLLIVS